MPQFNVGDRVRRTSIDGGYEDVMEVGDIGVVIEALNEHLQCIAVQVVESHRRVVLKPIRFELVEAAPQPEEAQTATVYTVFYRSNVSRGVSSMGYSTAEKAEISKQSLIRNGHEVIAMKKIKINLGQ